MLCQIFTGVDWSTDANDEDHGLDDVDLCLRPTNTTNSSSNVGIDVYIADGVYQKRIVIILNISQRRV